MTRKFAIKNKEVRKKTSLIYDRLVTLLYPRHCPFCDKIVPYGAMVHETCASRLDYADRHNTCLKCGKPLLYGDAEFCRDCRKGNHLFDRGFSLYPYRTVSGAIYRFKYAGRQEYADFFAEEMERHLGPQIRSLHADLVIPVPMYGPKENKRGYNQAAVLARAIGKTFSIPVNERAVKRLRNTIPMKELSDLARRRNLKKAFIVTQNDVKLKKIILIDDIYTTGTTVDHVSWQLRKAGASNIYVLTVAIGQTT